MGPNDAKPPVDDGFSWRHPLVAPIEEGEGFRHFSFATTPREDGKVPRSPLARGERLSLYVQRCGEGQGENFVHAHRDEAGWLVLAGEAVFYDEKNNVVAHVRGGEGIALSPHTAYRYVCHGDETVMIRAAAKLDG